MGKPERKVSKAGKISEFAVSDETLKSIIEASTLPPIPWHTLFKVGPPVPLSAKAVNEMKHLWHLQALEAAAGDGNLKLCRSILRRLLLILGLNASADLLARLPAKKGRIASEDTHEIVVTWFEIGKPSPYKSDLAKAYYAQGYWAADQAKRKQYVDRCARAIRRTLGEEKFKAYIETHFAPRRFRRKSARN